MAVNRESQNERNYKKEAKKRELAESASKALVEEVLSNIDNQIEKRLNQENIQNVKAYYPSYKRNNDFLGKGSVILLILAGLFIYSGFGQRLVETPDAFIEITALIALSLIAIKHYALIEINTNLYIRRMANTLVHEQADSIFKYIERATFGAEEVVKTKNFYYVYGFCVALFVALYLLFSLAGLFYSHLVIGALWFFSIVALTNPFDVLFEKIKVKKHANRKR